jgi:hypothetical protein
VSGNPSSTRRIAEHLRVIELLASRTDKEDTFFRNQIAAKGSRERVKQYCTFHGKAFQANYLFPQHSLHDPAVSPCGNI